MHGATRWMLATMAVLVISVAPGCLRRKEMITVHQDLSVDMVLDYEQEQKGGFGKEYGLKTVAAMPGAETGWTVTYTDKADGDKVTRTLHAEQSFPPDAALPQSFRTPENSLAGEFLQFPTEVWTEDREDGRYYYFRRTYQPRPWAFVEYWQHLAVDDDVKKLMDKPSEELTDEQRLRILKAQALAAAFKPIAITKAAIDQANIDIDPTIWLDARRQVLDYVEGLDFEPFIELQKQLESTEEGTPQRQALEQELAAMAKPFDLETMALHSLIADSLNDRQREAFGDAWSRVELGYKITDELGGHAFEIHVKLPGEVIAHNGDKIEDGAVVWEFDGDAVRDRANELLVVSRVQIPMAESGR